MPPLPSLNKGRAVKRVNKRLGEMKKSNYINERGKSGKGGKKGKKGERGKNV
jgi:hypothetical protein